MNINFKYYKTVPLLTFILILSFIYLFIKNLLTPIISFDCSNKMLIDTMIDTVGWFSPVFIIFLIILFIDRIGWKWTSKFCNVKWLVDLPNLNGRYKGKLKSSFKDNQGNNIIKDCVIEIKQNASFISIYSYYADEGTFQETSKAYSVSEKIVKERNGVFSIYYIFSNEPDSMIDALNKHIGTSKFVYFPDKKQLKGEYYNHRSNKGTIEVSFVQEDLLHRFAE